MHLVVGILVSVVLAGVAGLTIRSIRTLILVSVLAIGLGRRRFRIRLSRIAGEVLVAIGVAYASSQLLFYGGRLEPQRAVKSALHVNIPFLHWFATTFGSAILAFGIVIIAALYGFAALLQYEAVTPLRKMSARGSRPTYVRVAFFNTGIIFCKRRSPITWLRTELSCLVLSVLTAASGPGVVSESEFIGDKTFRRILGSSALDWGTLISAATNEQLAIATDAADLAGEPLADKAAGIVHGHII